MPPYCEEHKMHHVDELECILMRAKTLNEVFEAARRIRSEQIAAEVLKAHGTDYRADGWWCDCGHRYGVAPSALADKIQIHRMESATLAALTEKENAS